MDGGCGCQAKSSLAVRGHAARLFFNLSYMRPNRPAFLRKGAMDHIDFVVNSVGDAAGDTIQQKMVRAIARQSPRSPPPPPPSRSHGSAATMPVLATTSALVHVQDPRTACMPPELREAHAVPPQVHGHLDQVREALQR